MTGGPFKRMFHAWSASRADRIAVVRLDGSIGSGAGGRGGLTGEGMESVLRRAFDVEHLKAVVIVVNSPGGSPTQSEYIAERIRQLASEKGVRVLAFCEDIAASGGYWIACAADEIFAARTSMVGSIGVVSSSFGLSQLIERLGIERRLYSTGESKARLDTFSPVGEGDVEWMLQLQAQLQETFIAWVRQRRGAKLTGSDAELFNGDVWVGRRAVELGLVDGIGVMRSVIAERYPDAEITAVDAPTPLLQRLTGGQVRARTSAAVLQGALDAVEKRADWARLGR
ncbi:S49 family peptidase [Gordonia sp. TBRC 11910]|uniref:S49 family peptidase n=1 Tax=Gordonia asplenii TaxID=2725283 RepID=A0A848L1P1_9ACTN|nr:S49 family peptidase [Gordonia asplenii]NMO04377.1 S49 family peptidase [Gordonia asplenii]